MKLDVPMLGEVLNILQTSAQLKTRDPQQPPPTTIRMPTKSFSIMSWTDASSKSSIFG